MSPDPRQPGRIDPRTAPLPHRLAERLARELTLPIAARLHLSQWTVLSHMARIRDKLGARSQAHAVAIALTSGVLPAEYVTDTPSKT